MPRIYRRAGDIRITPGQGILELIRRYGGHLSPSQSQSLRATLIGNVGTLPPGINRPQLPGPTEPFDIALLFDDSIPTKPVMPTSAPGVENVAARVDHQHQGVHTLHKLGAPELFGDLTMEAVGGLMSLLQVGNHLQFTLTLADILQYRVVEQYQLVASHPRSFTLLYHPLGEVAVYFAGWRKHRYLHYEQDGRVITFVNSLILIDFDLVTFEYWMNPTGGSDASDGGVAPPAGEDEQQSAYPVLF